jgi:predicted ATPase
MEQAEALGDPLEDPLMLFSVLYGAWVASYNAFEGDAVLQRAEECLGAAEKQATPVTLMVGRRLVGISLFHIGKPAEGRAHLDYARRLYNAAEHRPLATRFGQDIGVGILYQRALPLWMLGYPDAALVDCVQAMSDAREIGLVTTLMPALLYTSTVHILCGNNAIANEQANELVLLSEGSALWKAVGVLLQGTVLALTGRSSAAGQTITTGLSALRSTGSTLWTPLWASCLAKSFMDLGQSVDAWRWMNEALTTIETSKERLFEPEVHRMAGEIALLAPEPDFRKAESHLARSLATAREQSAKSWELRAAISLARLWRDQGERDKAMKLLSPIYGWFTEGFDMRDLLDAKVLLDELR